MSEERFQLLINARDAFSGSLRREIEIRGGDLPGLVRVEIADSGPGVPADLKTAIFDPFFSTEPPGKGTGLGLPKSLSIVDSLGGRLELRDTDGAGTVFRITLPSAPDEDEPEAVHPENTDASVRSRQAR
ncbi:sensor histidine kinase [Thiocapsa bogorovii]|uniref:sensor histidine kinase n=1 Tax=Thiocapsa bogorovii TaxID=521689 RepID=UPI0038CDA1D3